VTLPVGPLTGVLHEAATHAGLDTTGARPLRIHSNAVFALPRSGAVLRIADGALQRERAERAVLVTRWLAGQGFPAVRPLDLAQPVEVPLPAGGSVAVTYWHLVPAAAPDIRPSAAALARLLRDLHRLVPPVPLPGFRPLARVVPAVEECPLLDRDERGWLRARIADLTARLAALEFPLPGPVLVHGDAHRNNLIVAATGGCVLADWDNVALDRPEWDLVPTTNSARYGVPPGDRAEFAARYGWDLASWPDWTVLRDLHELRSLGAYLRRAPISPPHATELRRRLTSLRTNDRTTRWYPVG
jgi:aminoglycoside phosphotransferase (APT) family kinase protein